MSSAGSRLDGLITHAMDAQEIDVLVATSPKPSDDVTLHRLEMTDELAQEFRDSALKATPEEGGVVLVPYNATYIGPRRTSSCISLLGPPRGGELLVVS